VAESKGGSLEVQAHGALIEVLGVGVLLLGPSGIGKSECALELVHRGHRLVADDVVRIRRDDSGTVLHGKAPEVIRHYMEIRGIGLLYIPDLFGDGAVRGESTIDLVCHLEEWDENSSYERVGLDRPLEDLAGVSLPALILPARPAGSMATVVEVAVRDHLHRLRGTGAAERLDRRLQSTGPTSS
jgi:HPr kinase/phosphorylase